MYSLKKSLKHKKDLRLTCRIRKFDTCFTSDTLYPNCFSARFDHSSPFYLNKCFYF